MSNVTIILNNIRKFTPKGQDLAIDFLKNNRQVLSRELGFADIPSLISSSQKYSQLSRELLSETDNINSIISAELWQVQTQKIRKSMDKIVSSFDDVARARQSEIPCILVRDLSDDFGTKKSNLMDFCEVNSIDYLSQIRFAESPEEMCGIVKNLFTLIGNKAYEVSGLKAICDKGIRKTPEYFEALYRCQQIDGDLSLQLQKIILSPSKNKQVLALENLIKERFALDYIHIRDLEHGKQILEALEIAQKENLPIPQNVIVSPFFNEKITTMGQHFSHTNGSNTICLKADVEKEILDTIKDDDIRLFHKANCFVNRLDEESGYCSTSHPLHTILHEIIHGETKVRKKITLTDKFKLFIEKLTGYAKDNAKIGNFEETRTELRTKEVLEGLNSQEKEFLVFIS